MSLGVALKTAASGLQAAQASLRVVSDNIANVNTPGYVRKAVIQQPLVVDGVGQGVKIDGIKRITDQYLQGASLTAASDAQRWSSVSQYLDNAQSLFGDPSSTTFFFNRLDKIYGAFATAADDPTSTLLRSQALSNVEDFLSEADRINASIVQLGDTVETRAWNAPSAYSPGYITAVPHGSSTAQPIQITSGELRGLMDLRDQELPKLYDQLGEFVSRAAEQLNAAHNASAAYPPPATLTGRDTGLDLPTAVNGFTGTSTIAVVNASGVLQRSIAIDFTGGTISVNGGAGAAFTPATFLAGLNGALAGAGSATFTNGALTLNATGGNGLALDEGTSAKTGRGFSAFFGLNDLVKATGFTNYETGLQPTDNHGFTPGGQITLHMAYPDGRPVRDVTVTVPAAPLVSDLLTALNSSAT